MKKKLVKNLVFGLLFTFFVSACGRGFHTFYVDTDAPTSSNPLEADLLDISKIDSEERLAFCEKAGLNGFSSLKNKEFICSLLPSAIRLNQRVYKQRLQTQTLLEKSQNSSLSSAETEWLARLKTSYKLDEDATLTELLSSVDVVPLSLLMAQAALESGWGTSRFAVEGKNFFGIRGSAKTDQCQWAGESKNICVKKYNSKIEGLADYIQFLNTTNSSKAFRQRRAQFRKAGAALDSLKLAETLNQYSEQGSEYIRKISLMMKNDDLNLAFSQLSNL